MSICAPCQKSMNNLQHDGLPEKRSIVIFLCSVDNGCYICRRLFHNLPKHDQSYLRGLNGPLPRNQRHGGCFGDGMPDSCESRGGPPVVSIHYMRSGADLRVVFRVGYENTFHSQCFGLMMERPSKVSSMVPPSWRITSSSTGSEETFTKIKKWLDSCNSKHRQCHHHREQGAKDWYPTRLVHISWRKGHGRKQLRLRLVDDGAHLAVGSQYATLSHRWGEADMVKLTVGNLSSWRQSIPTKILPQTFVDAARATKRLGIEYLWIDCLCIIQEGDQFKDWKQEAPTMQNVYSNACFNICASWGSTIGGLFTKRDPVTVQDAMFEMLTRKGRKKVLLLSNDNYGAWEELVERSPLSSRGWAFQERLLAPRNIFFCKKMVLYECYEQRWSESTGPDVVPWIPVLECEFWGDTIQAPNIKTLLPIMNKDIYHTWRCLVEKYSGTKLTFAEDRLAAVAGIAQRFSESLKDDVYVAGLWLSRLSLDMLWQNVEAMPDPKENDSSSRPTQLTFSWISGYQATINEDEYEPRELDEKFILPQVTCVKWRTSADTDAEKYLFNEDIIMIPSTPSIEIMVRGILKRMRLQRDQNFFYVFPVDVPEAENTIKDIDEREDLFLSLHKSCDVSATLDFAATERDISVLNDSGRLFYVHWYDNDRDPFVLSKSYCLLLELICGEMGRFRRIGLLHFIRPYRHLYLSSQVSEQGYPYWKNEQSPGEHTFFIV